MVDHGLIVNCILLILAVGLIIACGFTIDLFKDKQTILGDYGPTFRFEKPLACSCTALCFAVAQIILCACALAKVMNKIAWYVVLACCCVAYIICFALMFDCCHHSGRAGQTRFKDDDKIDAFLGLLGCNFIGIIVIIIAVLIVEKGKC